MKTKYYLGLLLMLIFVMTGKQQACGQGLISNMFNSIENFSWSSENWFKAESVSIYGGGKILGIATSEDDGDTNIASPTGTLGMNFSSKNLTSNIYYSINGIRTVEVSTLSQLGAILVNPNRGGENFNFDIRTTRSKYGGVTMRYQIFNQLWQLSEEETYKSHPVVFKFGGYLTPFDFSAFEGDNNIGVSIELMYTYLNLSGEFSKQDRMIENQIVPNKSDFHGWDFSVNFRFNDIKLYVLMTKYYNGFDIPNFTGTQVLFGVDITGNLIKLAKAKDE